MAAKKVTKASRSSKKVADLVVKKSGQIRGGRDTGATMLSGPFDDRAGATWTHQGDPSK